MKAKTNEAPPAEANEYSEVGGEISLGDLLFMVRERWLLGLAIGLLLSTLLLFFLLSRTKRFDSSSTLLVRLSADQVVDIDAVVNTDLERGKQLDIELNNHIHQMESSNFLDQVAEKVEENGFAEPFLEKYREELPVDASDSAMVRKIVGQSLRFSRQRNTQVLTLTARHRNPDMAAELANLASKQYVRFSLNRTLDGTTGATASLVELVAESEKNLLAREVAYNDYRTEHNLSAVDENEDTEAARVTAIGRRMTEAEVKLTELEADLSLVGSAKERGANLLEIPFVSDYGSIPSLVKEMEMLLSDRARLDQRYLRLHPKVIENTKEMEAKQRVLDQNVSSAVADAQNQAEEQRDLISDLSAKLTDAKERKVDVGGVAMRAQKLQTELATAREMHKSLLDRLQETKVSASLENTNIEISNLAKPAAGPAVPNKKLSALASMGLFGLTLLGVPLVLGLFDNKLKRVGDLEGFLGHECAGCVPMMSNKDVPANLMPLAIFKDLDESVTESFRGIYSFLELTSTEPFPKAMLITSTCPAEGKSFVSTSLSGLFGKHGKKTIIVDCDFRKPTQHKNFHAKNDHGTIRWFESNKPLNSESVLKDEELGIHQIGETNVYLLAAGGSSKSPTEMTSDPRFGELISALKSEFDLVIIDTPPVGLFPDALFLSEFVDEILYVTKHNHLPRHQVKAAITKFAKSPARLIGVVFNQMKQGSIAGYGYGNYGYGSYSNKYYQKYYSDDHR